MTDPRLLVPLDKVPEMWPGEPVGADEDRAPFVGEPLDLSAPPADEHGHPARRDALLWARSVLRRRLGWSGGVLIRDINGNPSLRFGFRGDYRWITRPHAPRRATVRTVYPWPDLTGTDDDTATRLIVAAALRVGVGLD